MVERNTETEGTDVPRVERARASKFEQQGSRAGRSSSAPIAEFWYSLRRSGKWWMAPILLALLTAGAVLVLSGSAIAPLIYAIF